MVLKKSIKKLFSKTVLFIAVTVSIFLLPTTLFNAPVYAQSSSELNTKVNDLNNQLQDIKKKKEEVEKKIKEESNNQSNLSSQLSLYDAKVQEVELSIEEKIKTIESLETQILLLESQVKEKESNISILENKINNLNRIYKERVLDNFKNSFNGPIEDMLRSNSFDLFMIKKEFSNSLAQQSKQLSDELYSNKEELNQGKLLIEENLKTQQNLQDQIKAETTGLGYQKAGLDYQKNQKALLLDKSKQNSKDLAVKREELQKTMNEKQSELDAYIALITSSKGSGNIIKKGDILGYMGRSGYVLQCNGNNCYYPDLDKEPCGGAHTHFEIAKNISGKYVRTDPFPYLNNEKVGKPYNSMYITQGYMENPAWYPSTGGHPGIDLVGDAGCGTPIYAGASGLIRYYCNDFKWPGYRSDPTYLAVLYDPINDINITYMHLKKSANSC